MNRFSPLVILLLLVAGCGRQQSGRVEQSVTHAETQSPTTDDRSPFKDDVETNAEAPANIDELTFVNITGEHVQLKDYYAEKNVVLVFTRGFSGMLCPFCKTQTSRLISNYGEFQQRDAEILLVYPGARDHLDEFVEAAKFIEKKQVDRVPFPILLDEDLAAVKHFDIAAELAHPSTYIIDKEGKVRFAYVGTNPSDRPSVKALLRYLDGLSP